MNHRLTRQQLAVLHQLRKVRLVRASTRPATSLEASARALRGLAERELVEVVPEAEAPSRPAGVRTKRLPVWYRLTQAGHAYLNGLEASDAS